MVKRRENLPDRGRPGGTKLAATRLPPRAASLALNLFGVPEQLGRAFQVVGAIGIKEWIDPRPLFREIHNFQAIPRGPDIDLADSVGDDRLAQGLAQPHRPKADNRMRPPARRG